MAVLPDDWTLSSLSGAMDWAVLLPPGAAADPTASTAEQAHAYPALYTELTPTVLTGSASATTTSAPVVYARLSSIVSVEKVGPRQLRLRQQFGYPGSYRLLLLTASSEASCDDWWRALHRLTYSNNINRDINSAQNSVELTHNSGLANDAPTAERGNYSDVDLWHHQQHRNVAVDKVFPATPSPPAAQPLPNHSNGVGVAELKRLLLSPDPHNETSRVRASLRLPPQPLSSPLQPSRHSVQTPPSPLPPPPADVPRAAGVPPHTPPPLPRAAAASAPAASVTPAAGSLSASTIDTTTTASTTDAAAAATTRPRSRHHDHDHHHHQYRRRYSDAVPPSFVVPQRATYSEATQTAPSLASVPRPFRLMVAPTPGALVSQIHDSMREAEEDVRHVRSAAVSQAVPASIRAAEEGVGVRAPPPLVSPAPPSPVGVPSTSPVLPPPSLVHSPPLRHASEQLGAFSNMAPAHGAAAAPAFVAQTPPTPPPPPPPSGFSGPPVDVAAPALSPPSSAIPPPPPPLPPAMSSSSTWRTALALVPTAAAAGVSSPAPQWSPGWYAPIQIAATSVPRARSASPAPLPARLGIAACSPSSFAAPRSLGWQDRGISPRTPRLTYGDLRAFAPMPQRGGWRDRADGNRRSTSRGSASRRRGSSASPVRRRGSRSPHASTAAPARSRSRTPPVVSPLLAVIAKPHLFLKHPVQPPPRSRSSRTESVATYAFVTTDEDCIVTVPANRFMQCVEETQLLAKGHASPSRSPSPTPLSSVSIAVRSYARAKAFFGDGHCRAIRVGEVDRVTCGSVEPLILLHTAQRERFPDPTKVVCIVSHTHAFLLEATNATEAEWYVRCWKKYLRAGGASPHKKS